MADSSFVSTDVRPVFDTEFIYYSSVLRIFAASLRKEQDRKMTRLWLRKLFAPEYHSSALKPKRNRYLLYLTITLYNDETFGIFRQNPPAGVLPELDQISPGPDAPEAAWELETQWQETLEDLPSELLNEGCYLHSEDCPVLPEDLSALLDATFHYFLWLGRPYVSLMPNSRDKIKAASWIQVLCAIAPDECDCPELKGLRNDYMQALLGYVHDLRLAGPFCELPPREPIPPLTDLASKFKREDDFSDPTGQLTDNFLSQQPFPESGAFAYINITGELFKTNIR